MKKIVISSKTEKKQTQRHFVLEHPLPVNQSNHTQKAHDTSHHTTTTVDFNALLNQHYNEYQASLQIPGWREVLWATDEDLQDLNLTQYTTLYSTSFEAQAIRQGLNTHIKPLGVAGLVKTKDNFFVFGLRTGVAMGGYLCNAPAGHCGPEQKGENILEAGFIEELETELGVTRHEISHMHILGHQSDPDFGRAVNVVISAEINLRFDEIEQRHQKGQSAFQTAKESGLSYEAAKLKMKADGHINIDSHEHDLLVAVPADRKTLEAIVQTKQLTDKYNKNTPYSTYPVMDIAKGSLIMHLLN